MIQNESQKNLLGQVLNHYRTEKSLKISAGRQVFTIQFVISRVFHHLERKLQYDLLFDKFTKIKQ